MHGCVLALMTTLTPADAVGSADGIGRPEEAVMRWEPRLTDVVRWTRARKPDSFIIQQIRQSGVVYHLTSDQMVWLKNNGVKDSVIEEMQRTAFRSR